MLKDNYAKEILVFRVLHGFDTYICSTETKLVGTMRTRAVYSRFIELMDIIHNENFKNLSF